LVRLSQAYLWTSFTLFLSYRKRASAYRMTSPRGKGTLSALDEVNRLIRENRVDEYPSATRELGMRPERFGSGTAEWSWVDQPALVLNQFGVIQGGYLAVFVDEIFATAIGSVLEQGEWGVTIEVKLSYLRALFPRPLRGYAKVLYRTRSLAFLEANVVTSEGETAVTASSTWAIRTQSTRT